MNTIVRKTSRSIGLLVIFLYLLMSSPPSILSYAQTQRGETLRIGNGTITVGAWSPDGRTIAVGGSLGIDIYNADLQLQTHLNGNTGAITSLSWNPDKHTLLTGTTDDRVLIWDVDEKPTAPEIAGGNDNPEGHTDQVRAVAWSPDGSKFASGSLDKTVIIWDTVTRKVLFKLQTPDPVLAIAWSPDGTTLASAGTNIQIWNIKTRQVMTTYDFTAHHMASFPIQSLAWSPDGKTLASGAYAPVIWDIATGNPTDLGVYYNEIIRSVAWNPSGTALATAGSLASLFILDVSNRKLPIALQGHTNDVTSISWNPAGTKVVSIGLDDGTIRLWDTADGNQIAMVQGFTTPPFGFAWSPDGKSIAESNLNYGQVSLWDTSYGNLIATLDTGGHFIAPLTWGAVSGELAGGDAVSGVVIWDAITHRIVNGFSVPETFALAWSPDGQSIAADGLSNPVFIWNTSGTIAKLEPQILGTPKKGIFYSVTWSPDSKRVASGMPDGSVQVWDVATRNLLFQFQGHSDGVTAVAWSPNGKYVASASDDKTVQVWDATTGQLIKKLTDHTGAVKAVAWNPSGTELASAGDDRIIRIWDTITWQSLMTLTGPTDSITAVAWNSDGTKLATASLDGTIRIFGPQGTQPPTVADLRATVASCVADHDLGNSLNAKIDQQDWNAFINEVEAQSGKKIDKTCADQMIATATFFLTNPPLTPTSSK